MQSQNQYTNPAAHPYRNRRFALSSRARAISKGVSAKAASQ
jgi:hypothetical protein